MASNGAIVLTLVFVGLAVEGVSECESGLSDPTDQQVSLLQNGLSVNSKRMERSGSSALDAVDKLSAVPPHLPTAALVPEGQCVFTEDWSSAPLLSKESISHNTRLFTFGLADPTKPLGLATCAAIKMRVEANGTDHPYTPISTNALLGKFTLMIKIYPDGRLTPLIDALKVGDRAQFSHTGVKIQYPFNKPEIGMIAGGTGIAPMIQALNAILGTDGDESRVSLLYANQKVNDILAKDTLDLWSSTYPSRLSVVHVLSQEPETSDWIGYRGHIDGTHIQKYMPPPSSDCLIFVCGPNDKTRLSYTDRPGFEDTYVALLGDMGYKPEQIVLF